MALPPGFTSIFCRAYFFFDWGFFSIPQYQFPMTFSFQLERKVQTDAKTDKANATFDDVKATLLKKGQPQTKSLVGVILVLYGTSH